MRAESFPLRHYPEVRRRRWWAAPLATGLALLAMAAYAAWAVLSNADYYAAPYLSPLYSPCLAQNCLHVSAPLVGEGWEFSPGLLVLWIPIGLRATCYYYRKAYYRSFFLSPAACGVADARAGYAGETRFPLLIQNLHRYFFYLSLPVLAFLWWDAGTAFRFPEGIGVGVGSLVLLANAVLLTLFAASCNSCRHVCGGHMRSLHDAPLRRRVWKLTSVLNVRHREYAWASLVWVLLADAYVRLLARGVLVDLRLL